MFKVNFILYILLTFIVVRHTYLALLTEICGFKTFWTLSKIKVTYCNTALIKMSRLKQDPFPTMNNDNELKLINHFIINYHILGPCYVIYAAKWVV